MSDYIDKAVAGVVATVFAAITWLVRRVLTNQQEILILKEEIKNREEQRNFDRSQFQSMKTENSELLKEMRLEIKELRLEINSLYRQK